MLKPAFIDLSHHNVIPQSLKPAKQSGIVGVIHKATEGTSYVDDGDIARSCPASSGDSPPDDRSRLVLQKQDTPLDDALTGRTRGLTRLPVPS